MAILASPELIQAIQKYKAGDQAAFDEIYHGSIQYITKCVLNVLNRTAAGATEDLQQDIIQETYLSIATKLDSLESEEAFLQWAGQIATNHALRTWQKDLRQHEQEQPEDEELYELADERFIPEDILENKEKQQLIRKMLQELPTNQYLCLVEYFYNGLKETEIAQKLEMPLGTVKTNLSRAKKKLKEIVQSHEKKSGVKLYSMSWLLLLLFWQDIKALFIDPGKAEKTLEGVHCAMEVGAVGAAGVGAASSASGSAAAATGTAATATSAAAAGTSTAVGTALGTKIIAGVLAAVVTIGGITAVNSSEPVEIPVTQDFGEVIDGTLYYQDHRYRILECEENIDVYYPEEWSVYKYNICEWVGGRPMIADTWQEWHAVVKFIVDQGYNLEYSFMGVEHDNEEIDPSLHPIDYIIQDAQEPIHTDYYVICEWHPDQEMRIPEVQPPQQMVPETVEVPEITEPPETTEPTQPPVVLTETQLERMERILLYTAFLDSGVNDGLILASYGAMLNDVEPEKDPFLRLTEPLPEWWAKNDLLLLMGWNKEPVLEVESASGFWCNTNAGAYCYSLSTAEKLMTGMFGAFESDYLDGNIFINGYYTEIAGGKVYQPAEHLYLKRYGTLTVDEIEQLGDGQVRIYATYSRDITLNCVYEAVLNEESYIGVTLTGVSYSFAE